MSDAADRRSLLLTALALGGGASAAEALAPAIARAASSSDASGARSVPATQPGMPPEVYGADGTAAGDSAGLRAAIASDAVAIDLAPRTYRLDAVGLSRLALSGKELRGVRGRTIIRLAEPPRGDMVFVLDARNFAIRDIVFDGAGLLAGPGPGSYPGFRPCLLLERCERFAVAGCSFIGFDTCGLLTNVTSDAAIVDNRADRGQSASMPNYGIGMLGGGRAIVVRDNIALACNVAVDVRDATIAGNDVSGWGFSAGLNIAEDEGNARDLVVAFNRCHVSAAVPDRDGFYLDGIECWAPGSILLANQCRRSIGNGISFGAADMIVAANQCYDNGSLLDGRAVGWGIRALADAQDASHSLVVGNRCGDTRAAGLRRQAYGYGENSATLAGIELWANLFDGNAIGSLDLHSPATRVDGIRTGSFVPTCSEIAFSMAAGTYLERRGATRVSVDVTLPPTRDRTPFTIDGLPTPAMAWGVLEPVLASRADLRLAVAPGSRRAVAAAITNADLSGQRVVLAGEYMSAGT